MTESMAVPEDNPNERYETLNPLAGEGGFGKVSIQMDKFLERKVARKQLTLFDEDSKARFAKEAKTLARLSHPNIPAIYDVKFSNHEMLIYCECIDGQTLRQIINSGDLPSPADAQRWFLQVASALQHAHESGVYHRDIKPDNIIISPDRQLAVLVDFGIAITKEEADRHSVPRTAIGTEGYMPPEQMQGRPVTPATDIYALGVTLYECLSGNLPVGEWEELSSINEAIPSAFDKLIAHCLKLDIAYRLDSAASFAQTLREALRSNVPFSQLLTDAPLHELAAALTGKSSQEFAHLPRGQQFAVVTRVIDLLKVDKVGLRRPAAEMLASLLRLGVFLPAAKYSELVQYAFEWGYRKQFGPEFFGNPTLQNALVEVAKMAPKQPYEILATAFIAFHKAEGLSGKLKWYTHHMRETVVALLANPECNEQADELDRIYREINDQSH